MKKIKRIALFTIILLAISLGYSFDANCLEKSKKATWIKPLEKGVLNIGKFTYEYTASRYQYEGTFRILQNKEVRFTDKVGDVGEVTWLDPSPVLEPFQMITVNSTEPPVVLFYSKIGRHELEIRIYSTTEPKLLDVLNVGEAGAEVKDLNNDGILEFETENCFKLPSPYKSGYCIYALYHFSKGKFKLAKGGDLKSIYLENAGRRWREFEKYYGRLIEIKNKGEDWNKIREKYWHSEYRVILARLGGWLADVESTGDHEKIKEALDKFKKMEFLLEEEKKGLIECLIKAGYGGLDLKE